MSNKPQVDLFILHSAADADWVEDWLIPKLTEAGVTVATHEDFRIGRTVALNYELTVEQSRYVAFMLTPEGLDDRWAAFAASLALHRDPANLTERLLPLLVRPCPQLPAPLRDLTPANFTSNKPEIEVVKLIDALSGQMGVFRHSPSVSTHLAFQAASENEILIVIAEFVHRQGADDTDPAGEIALAIRSAAKKLSFTNLRVEVESTQIGRLNRKAAESLGRKHNAAIVVWGEVSTVAVTTNFLNLSEPELPAADITIHETERTQSKQELSGVPIFSEYVTQNLPDQLIFLAFFAVGSSYYLAEDFVSARIAIAQGISCLPNDAKLKGRDNAFFILGLLDQIAGNFIKAIINYNEALYLNPAYIEAYGNRGNALRDLQQYKEAIRNYDKVIELSPIDTKAYNNRGVALCELEQYAEAITSYNKAIELKPNNPEAYSNRGNTLLALGKYAEAYASYGTAIELNPVDAKTYYNQGNLLSEMNEFIEAIVSYDMAIKLNPGYADAYNNRGNANKALNRYTEAIACYDKAIELNSGLAVAYNNRGHSFSELKQHTKAIANFDKAIELYPTYAIAYGNRGNAFLDLKEYGDAITSYDRAIEFGPEITASYLNRGVALEGLKLYEESIASYDKAIELDPTDAEAYYNRGNALSRIELYEESIASYNKAIYLNPAHATACDNRGIVSWYWGMTYAQQGNFVRAVELMQVRVDYEREFGHPDAETHAELVEEYRRRAAAGE